jgi:O-antigen/teichoic acid export membrane protein
VAAGYVVAVVLGRELGKELYGVYGVIMSVLLPTELIGRLGIPQATSKLLAEVRGAGRAIESTAITLTSAIFLALGTAFYAAAPWLSAVFEVEDGTALFRLAAIDIPFYGMFFCLQNVLNGERRFAAESLGLSLYGVAKALGVVALLAGGVTLEGALIVNALASVVACGYSAARLSPQAFRPTLAAAEPILRLALPTALFTLGAQLLGNLDLWFLKWVGAVSDEAVGLYVAANRIAMLPNLALFATTAILIPTVSRAASAGDHAMVQQLVRGAARLLLLAVLPACAYLALRSGPIMVLVYGAEYAGGALYQSLLVLRFGFFGVLLMTACGVLIALGEPRRAALEVLQLVVLAALLCLMLIPPFGAVGAAVASLAAVAVGVGLCGWWLTRRLGPVLPVAALGSALVATAAWCALLSRWSVEGPGLLIEVPLVAALHLGLLLLLRAVTAGELRALVRHALRR